MTIRSKQKLNYSNAKPFNIVLVEPEIPPNTGNVARLCAATNTKLHLVHPLGFQITDKDLKRAGLDYWHLLDVKEYRDWEDFLIKSVKRYCEEAELDFGELSRAVEADEAISQSNSKNSKLDCHASLSAPGGPASGGHSARNDETCFWFISTRGEKNIWEVDFNTGDYLIFGSESKGLDQKILDKVEKDKIVSIPMNGKTRSLNLSTSVGIVLYEAIRQVTVEKKLVEVVPI